MNDFFLYADAQARLADVRAAAQAARRRKSRPSYDSFVVLARHYLRRSSTACRPSAGQ